MLQQTQVATVLAYFAALPASAFPTCARSPPPARRRARRSGAASATTAGRATSTARAQAIVAEHGGEFPRTSDGTGDAARHRPLDRGGDRRVLPSASGSAILDGNVKRVLARVLAFAGDLAAGRRRARALERGDARCCPARGIEPYTQGLMDLGATICLARAPRCLLCPVRDLLRRGADRRAGALPGQVAPRRARPARQRLARAALARAGLAGAAARRAACGPGLWSLPELESAEALQAIASAWPGTRRGAAGLRPRADPFRLASAAAALDGADGRLRRGPSPA